MVRRLSLRQALSARYRLWRDRRDLVIEVTAAAGVPKTWIASSLDLSRSRVKAILRARKQATRRDG